jgi:hypothetical protein
MTKHVQPLPNRRAGNHAGDGHCISMGERIGGGVEWRLDSVLVNRVAHHCATGDALLSKCVHQLRCEYTLAFDDIGSPLNRQRMPTLCHILTEEREILSSLRAKTGSAA